MKNAIFISWVFSLMFVGTVSATVINVPDDYETIQEGIDASVDGDTVLVAPGVYSGDGNRDISTIGKAITVISEQGAENTIIDGEGVYNGFNIANSEDSNTTVIGFLIQNVSIGINCQITSVSIHSNKIQNFSDYGIYITGNETTTPLIEDCVITQTDPGLVGTGTGIFMLGTADVTITGCEISECLYGLYAYSNSTSSPVVTFNMTYCDIRGNALYGIYFSTGGSRLTPRGTINYCNFEDNGSYAIYTRPCIDPETHIDARYNWWDSSDGYVPAGLVYDRLDFYGCPVVNCSGPLDGLYPGGIVQSDYVSGSFSADTILYASGSPYKINGYYGMEDGVHLTIEAGSELYFGSGTAFHVEGQLTADGNNGDHILLTSSADTVGGAPVAGTWNGVRFLAGSDGVLSNCDLQYADRCIDIYMSSPEIDSCVIHNFETYGIFVDGGYLSEFITSVIEDCVIGQVDASLIGTGIGIRAYGSVDVTISGCDINNCLTGIGLYPGIYNSPYFQVTYCEISDNASRGIHVSPWSSVPTPTGLVNYCNFADNGEYAFYAHLVTILRQ